MDKNILRKLRESSINEDYVHYYKIVLCEYSVPDKNGSYGITLYNRELEGLYEQIFKVKNLTNYIDLKDVPECVEEEQLEYGDTNLFELIETFTQEGYDNMSVLEDGLYTYMDGKSLTYILNPVSKKWDLILSVESDYNKKQKPSSSICNSKALF